MNSVDTVPVIDAIPEPPTASDVAPKFPAHEIAEWVGHRLGMCRAGSWSLWYADAIFVECHCCYAIRATSIGFGVGVALSILVARLF
jgi:hypothetical protein